MAALIRVAHARALIVRAMATLAAETAPIAGAAGRTLAETIEARIAQPPFDASAMDGYAVRFADCAIGAPLRVIGESAAGRRFAGAVSTGTAVRIFTGAPVPRGADHVLIQEDTERSGETIVVRAAQRRPGNIRPSGVDFARGAALAVGGDVLTGARLALIAAGNVAEARVIRRPRIAVIANGDELKAPGAALGPDDIVSSIPYGLIPWIEAWGGAPEFLGVARDDAAEISGLAERARDFDVIVPIGGASVGDRDLMRAAFEGRGFESAFAGVSVKPGKPTWFGRLQKSFVLGLPGNPASALVTARLFLKPAIERLLGRGGADDAFPACAAEPLEANGSRETYLRARLEARSDGVSVARAFGNQDSSLLSVLAESDILIPRDANAAALAAGALVPCLRL